MSQSITESRLSRIATKLDLRLHKSRCRTPGHVDFGGYMLTSRWGKYLVAGDKPFAFSLSLEDLAQELAGRGASF